MKKLKLVLITFLVYALTAPALQSQLLAVENASWLIHCRWMIPFGEGHQFWAYSIQGDTSINGNTYKKVYHYDCGIFPNGLPYPMPPLQAGTRTLAGFVRDANQKVFAIMKNTYNPHCPINNEFLLYDFSYHLGDTIKTCNSGYPQPPLYIIDNIVQNDPPYNRKTFYFGGNKLYEGIGSSIGLFEDFDMIDFYINLENYSINGLAGLGIETGINNYYLKLTEFEIYPNPARDRVTICLRDLINPDSANVFICDIQGQILMKQQLKQKNTEFDIAMLQTGLYMARIKSADGICVQKMFIVIR